MIILGDNVDFTPLTLGQKWLTDNRCETEYSSLSKKTQKTKKQKQNNNKTVSLPSQKV